MDEIRAVGRWLFILTLVVLIVIALVRALPTLAPTPPVQMPSGPRDQPGVSQALDAAFGGIGADERLHFVIQFERELTPDELDETSDFVGNRLDGPIPENAYITSVQAGDWVAVRDGLVSRTPSAVKIFELTTGDKLAPEIRSPNDPTLPLLPDYTETALGSGMHSLFVRFFDDVVVAEQAQILAAEGATQLGAVPASPGPTGTWAVVVPAANVGALAAYDEVRFIEPTTPPAEEDLDQAREEIGATGVDYDGTGATIAQWEPCQPATDHPDMENRVLLVGTPSSGCANSKRHPTMVAGIVITNGQASATNFSPEPRYVGIVPAARLRSYEWKHTSTVIDYPDAIAAGARISTNSFGYTMNDYHYETTGPYPSTSQDYDGIVSGRALSGAPSGLPRMLIVASSGNRGDVDPPFWRTARIRNSAKNVIAVGNVSSSLAGTSSVWLGVPAANSGRGPTMDGRLTPILSAPGTELLCVPFGSSMTCGPDTSLGGDGGITSTSVPGAVYEPNSGTSFSTPIVSGAAAQLRGIYEFECGFAPEPQDLRALLVHSARDLTRTVHFLKVPAATKLVGPDFVFGYGLVKVDKAAELVKNAITETISQGWVEHRVQLTSANQLVVANGVQQLRVTLVWDDPPYYTDYPPRTDTGILQNDLDLEIIDPNGNRHLPWVLDPGSPADPATRTSRPPLFYVLQSWRDHRNTIEQVVVDVPTSVLGQTWTIRVRGFKLRRAPQEYTLVSEAFQTLPTTTCGDFSNGTTVFIPNPLDVPDTPWAWLLFWLAVLILLWAAFETVVWIYDTVTNNYSPYLAVLFIFLTLVVLYAIFHLLVTGNMLALVVLVLLLLAYVAWRII
jgi:hypothetical protein